MKITETQVHDWLKSELSRQADQSGIALYSLTITARHLGSKISTDAGVVDFDLKAASGSLPTVAKAMTELRRELDKLKPSADAMRNEAASLLAEATNLDGKPCYITMQPNAADAQAEATQEGRTLPKPRPNPHDA